MVLDLSLAREVATYVDATTGVVGRRIFSDAAVYQLELEQIFARAWQFMAHESQIPNVGDYFLTSLGEDRVIVVRDQDGAVQVLLNTCRHRGNAVCRAEEGNTSSFMCTYHGWTYDLQGKLVGVPGYKELYHEALERERWGLIRAAQVATYKGFIFACLDPEAPTLYDYLGETGRMGINLLAQHGTNRIVPGIQKYVLPCNWKLAADNVWDWYHPQISHSSALMSGYGAGQPAPNPNGGEAPRPASGAPPNFLEMPQLVLLGEYGHAISGPEIRPDSPFEQRVRSNPAFDDSWRDRAEAREALGPIGIKSRGHPHIFPNMWITGNQVSMRFPKGPFKTEVWWFTLLAEEVSEEKRKAQRFSANHTFGPAGMLQQDDGENWEQSTLGTRGVVSRRYPLHYAMGLGRGEQQDDESGPPRIQTKVNEHAQLWLYRNWAEWMAAANWAELKANHPLPEGTV
jgi:phenylpropionate dioxygenase-like ring-hydroxylating dioxygenase large terminal subunit